MFSSSTFINSYNPTDKAIRFLDTNGMVAHTLNVCNYQKSGVFGKNLAISLEDGVKDYLLPFESNNDAKAALALLRDAINTLKPNCVSISSPGGGGTNTAIPITYLQYKTMRGLGTLVELQWYDVTDTQNDIFTDDIYVIRLLAQSSNDKYPKGQVLGTWKFVSLDTVNDKIVMLEDGVNNNFIFNSSLGDNSFTNSNYCTSMNESSIIAEDSTHIISENGSKLTVTNCDYIRGLNQTDVILNNSSNVTFDDIQLDLSAIGYNLTNVIVDKNTTIGKSGFTSTTNPGGDIDLYAYFDSIDQKFIFTSNNNTLNVTLFNDLTQSEAEFRIRYSSSGSNNIINVYDANNTLLRVIQANDQGNVVVFKYNKNTSLFELIKVDSPKATQGVTVQFTPTNGQVNFNLGTPVSQATELKMYVNGMKQIYGTDYSYNGTLGMAVYAENVFQLANTDRVEFIVY